MYSYNNQLFRNYYAIKRIRRPGMMNVLKAIIHRLLENIRTLIDDYNVTEEEFWHAVNYLHELGGRQEAALLAAGLGLEHFDLRQTPSTQRRAGNRRPRIIEGPLYVANARRWPRVTPGWMMALTPGK